MRKLAVIIMFALGLNACATMNKGDIQESFRQIQEKKLAAAVKLQKEGKLSAAVESLKALCAERGIPGVTDEALYRLSMLYLINGMDNDREFTQLAQHYMERLRKEYTYSSWAGMTNPVTELLSTITELRRQVQNSKNQNQSLSKENQSLTKEIQELRQNIEKLKRLDLELEQKH
jgi:hypothetical protein